MSTSSADPPAANEKEIVSGLRGSSLLVVGRCFSLGLNFAVQVVAVRYFTKEDFGVYAVALSAVAIAAVFAAFGMDKAALRILPKFQHDKDRDKFSAAAFLMGITSCVAGFVVIAAIYAAWMLGLVPDTGPQSISVLLLMIWMVPCMALEALVTSMFSVFGKPRAIFVRQHILGPMFRLIAVVGVIAVGGGIVAFALGQLLAALAGFAISLGLIQTLIKERDDFAKVRWSDVRATAGEVFRYCMTLAFGDLAFLFRSAMVVLIIGLFHSSSEVASFQAVFPAARLNDIVIATFTVLFIPSAARLFAAKASQSLNDLFCRTTAWTTVLSFPIFLVCFVMPEEVCVILFGRQYAASGSILAIVSLGFFVNAIFGMNLRLIRVVSGSKHQILVDVICMIAAVVLNFLLIPQFGAEGGAWAVLGGFVIQSLVCMAAVWMTVDVHPIPWRLARIYCLAGLLTWGLVLLKGMPGFPPIAMPFMLAIASLGFAILCRNDMEVANVFPEIARVPYLGRLLRSEQPN